MTGDQIFSIILAIILFIVFCVLVSNAAWYGQITGKDAISTSQANTLRWVNGITALIIAILFIVAVFRSLKTTTEREALYSQYLVK